MGYAEEKAQVEKKRRKLIYIVAAVLFAVVAALCVFSAYVPPATWKYHFRVPKISPRITGEMRLHFIDVGQGDCSVIELPDGKVMMVDGGNGSNDSDKAVMRYLQALDIECIDYLLVTHADLDHCGGLSTVLKYKQVDIALIPPIVPTVNASYARFSRMLNQEGCAVRYVSGALSLSMTDGPNAYTLRFLYPHAQDELLENINDHNLLSAVFWLDYHGVSALFTGDAPKSVENELMNYDALDVFTDAGVQLKDTEILKVSHHGSDSSTSEEFLRYMNVETAVISCGRDNEYGHPSMAVQNALGNVHASVYRTDTQGSVMITITQSGTYTVQTLG